MLGLFLTVFLLAAVWAVQRLSARILSKSNINGPPTASFLTGEHLVASIYLLRTVLKHSAGNLLQIIAPDSGRDFQLHLASVYGGVARVKGLLWVSLTVLLAIYIVHLFLQGNSLFVSDLKALNHILVQNQDIFEEWDAFAAYVLNLPQVLHQLMGLLSVPILSCLEMVWSQLSGINTKSSAKC